MLAFFALALLAQAQPAPPRDSAASEPSGRLSAPAAAVDARAQPAWPAQAARDLLPEEFPPSERARLDAELREYFAGEKREAWFWSGAGVLALGAGGALSAAQSDVAHGASYPLLDISVVQFGAALYLFWRTGDQVAQLSEQLEEHPCAFFAAEPTRMRRVNRGFSIYLPVEAATLVGGAAMAGVGATGKHDFLQGAGFGLVAQSVVMLVFDQFASARAQLYQQELDDAERRHAGQCALERVK
jgi:hypothetical protein